MFPAFLPLFYCYFLRVFFKRIPSKNIIYEYSKHFNQNEFLHELDLEMNEGKFYSSEKPHDDVLISSKQLLINLLQKTKRK